MFIKKQNFIFNCKKQDVDFIKSLDVKKIYERVKNFFNLKSDFTIKVKFLYSVNEFNFFSNSKFENWKCGFTLPHNIILIFAPSVIEKLTIHKKEEIPKIITHELSHICYGNIKLPKIALFDEGIATYLSFYDREIRKADSKINLLELLKKKFDKGDYHLSFIVVKKIIDMFGKEKLFLFLKKLEYSNFSEKFESIFGISIKDFQKMLTNANDKKQSKKQSYE